MMLQLWKLLSAGHLEYVEKCIVLEFIKLVYEPDINTNKVVEVVKAFFNALQPTSSKENSIASRIATHTSRSKSPSHREYNTDMWPTEKIVREIIKLNDAKQRGETMDFLKKNNINTDNQAPKYSFMPTINSNSKEIDRKINRSQNINADIDESQPFNVNRNIRSQSGGSPARMQNAHLYTNYKTNRAFSKENSELGISRNEMLYEKSKIKNDTMDRLIREKRNNMMKECTFKPNITLHPSNLKDKGDLVRI
jgi:protein subunit release factor A